MRTDASQRELPLKPRKNGLPATAFNAPDDVVTLCRSESEAVRVCLAHALRVHGRDQLSVARACGWKSDSCLSEIAKESNARRMPESRRERFATATGCNLLSQWLERQEAMRQAKCQPTERERAMSLAARLVAA